MKSHLLLTSIAVVLAHLPALASQEGTSSPTKPTQTDGGQSKSAEEQRRQVSEGESRVELRAKISESLRPVNKVLESVTGARKRWQEGHRREAFTTMFLAHRDLSARLPRQREKGEFPGFDLLSGLYLAQMSDEMGEPTEAYELYRRLIHSPIPDQEHFELRPDILLSYSELCGSLRNEKEAMWAFNLIAEGNAFVTYLRAAEEASSRSRFDAAERWVRKALELRPDDKKAKKCLLILGNLKAKGKRSGIG